MRSSTIKTMMVWRRGKKLSKTGERIHKDFMQYCRIDRGLKSTTLESHKKRILKFLLWLQENKIKVEEIDKRVIRGYLAWMDEMGISEGTQSTEKMALRCFLAFLEDSDVITKDQCLVMKEILKGKKQALKIRTVTREQYRQLKRIAALTSHRDTRLRNELLLATLWETGLRAKHLLEKIRVGNIDIGKRKILMYKEATEADERKGLPKYCYFSKETAEIMRTWIFERRLKPEDLLFKDVTYKQLKYFVKRIGEKAGMPDLTPHWFRHALCTRIAIETQGDVQRIMKLSGHRDVGIATGYAHLSDEEAEKIARKVL